MMMWKFLLVTNKLKNMKAAIKILFIVCGFIFLFVFHPCFGQTQDKESIYDRQGNKIYFDKVEDVFHIGFAEGTEANTRNEVLADLSNIANYTMFPDSSYRLIIKQGCSAFFKEKALKNNVVTYCTTLQYRRLDAQPCVSTYIFLLTLDS